MAIKDTIESALFLRWPHFKGCAAFTIFTNFRAFFQCFLSTDQRPGFSLPTISTAHSFTQKLVTSLLSILRPIKSGLWSGITNGLATFHFVTAASQTNSVGGCDLVMSK